MREERSDYSLHSSYVNIYGCGLLIIVSGDGLVTVSNRKALRF